MDDVEGAIHAFELALSQNIACMRKLITVVHAMMRSEYCVAGNRGGDFGAPVHVRAGRRRSGGGHVTGDGVATFARAFLYAGTPSVTTSVWDVADQPMNRLLPDFSRSWIGGQSKARALRVAALKLLSGHFHRNPEPLSTAMTRMT